MQPTPLHLAEQLAAMGVRAAQEQLAAAPDARSAWLTRRLLARRKAAALLLGTMRLVLSEPSASNP